MAFEIEEFTTARLDDIEVLSQKNRQPDEAPGVKLHLEMTLSNHALPTLAGHLKGLPFERNEAAAPKVTKTKDNQTGTLTGVEPVSDLPNLSNVGKHVKRIKWSEEVTGCVAVIRFATTEFPLDDCSCGPFTILPKEGGTCVVKFPLEAPNASEKVFAKLAKFKSRDIDVKVKQNGPADDGQKSLDDVASKDGGKGENWPFPGDCSAQEQIERSQKKLADNSPPPQSKTVEPIKPDAKPAAKRPGRRVVTTME